MICFNGIMNTLLRMILQLTLCMSEKRDGSRKDAVEFIGGELQSVVV